MSVQEIVAEALELSGISKAGPDIESMLTAHDSTVDLDEAVEWVSRIVGSEDHRAIRLRSLHDLT